MDYVDWLRWPGGFVCWSGGGHGVRTVFGVVVVGTLDQIGMGSGVPKGDMAMLVEQYQAGRLNLDDVVSGEIKLSDVNKDYDMIRGPKVNRTVITDFSKGLAGGGCLSTASDRTPPRR